MKNDGIEVFMVNSLYSNVNYISHRINKINEMVILAKDEGSETIES